MSDQSEESLKKLVSSPSTVNNKLQLSTVTLLDLDPQHPELLPPLFDLAHLKPQTLARPLTERPQHQSTLLTDEDTSLPLALTTKLRNRDPQSQTPVARLSEVPLLPSLPLVRSPQSLAPRSTTKLPRRSVRTQ